MEVLDELVQAASTEIAEYSRTEAALADLRARMANVEYDVITVKGMAAAKADRAEVRGLRTSLEATRKQIKAPALAHCKLIDAEAARITAELLKLETPIDEQIKAREAVVEAEKAAKEAAERARITAIHKRIATIREFVALAAGCRTAARIDDLLIKLHATNLDGFEEFSDEAAAAHLDAMERVTAILAEKTEQEAEQARIKAEQAEAAAKLAAERAEFEAAQAAAKAEADRVAAEHAAQVAADKAKAEAEAAKVAASLAKQRADIEAEAKRLSAEMAVQQAAQAAAQQRALQTDREAQSKRDAEAAAEQKKFAEEKAAFEAQVAEAKRVAEQLEQDHLDALREIETPPAPEWVAEIILEPADKVQAAIKEVATPSPTDGDVVWTAASEVADNFGWTYAEAIDRLAAIDWSKAERPIL